MTDIVREFFEKLAARGHEPLLHMVSGSLRFELSAGARIEPWQVAIKRGDVTVARDGAKADCVVQCEKELLARMLTGRENAWTAYLREEYEIQGAIGPLVVFQRLFPGPQAVDQTGQAAGYARRWR